MRLRMHYEATVQFCGEHTSEDFQGYMEGAAESGERVAQEVLDALSSTMRAPLVGSRSHG